MNSRVAGTLVNSREPSSRDVGENTTSSLVVPTGFPSNRTQDKLTRVTDVKVGEKALFRHC